MRLTRSKEKRTETQLPNVKVGNDLERKVCNMLGAYGFFALNVSNGLIGQPCDIIAMHGKLNILLDAKHLEKGVRFDFKNIQDNQHTCFLYAKEHNNIVERGFVIGCDETNTLYYLPYEFVEMTERANTQKSVIVSQLQPFNLKLEEWRKLYENYDRGEDTY